MGNPGETFVGIGAVGIGVLLVYAAYKNKPVLGPSGLLSQVFTSGKIGSSSNTQAPKQGFGPAPVQQGFGSAPIPADPIPLAPLPVRPV